MENSYNELPENFIEKESIDFKKNKKLFWFINIGSIVLIIPFVIPMFFFSYSINFNELLPLTIVYMGLLVGMIATLVVHELIHGLFFKVFGKGKLKFRFHGFAASCSMPNVYFKKWPYFIIGIAPFVVLNIILVVLSIVFYNTMYFIIAYISLIINFSGCIGDLYVSYRLLKSPKSIIINDYGIGMRIYDKVSIE